MDEFGDDIAPDDDSLFAVSAFAGTCVRGEVVFGMIPELCSAALSFVSLVISYTL